MHVRLNPFHLGIHLNPHHAGQTGCHLVKGGCHHTTRAAIFRPSLIQFLSTPLSEPSKPSLSFSLLERSPWQMLRRLNWFSNVVWGAAGCDSFMVYSALNLLEPQGKTFGKRGHSQFPMTFLSLWLCGCCPYWARNSSHMERKSDLFK